MKKQLDKKLKISFFNLPRKSYEKEKEKKNWNGNCKAFYVTRKYFKYVKKKKLFVCQEALFTLPIRYNSLTREK